MRLKLFAVLRHAVTMVGRRLKTYAFLSVTIILSFSFLLGYLLLTDSQQYNQYKELFSRRRGDVSCYEVMYGTAAGGSGRQKLLHENLDKMKNTKYFTAYYVNLGDMSINYDPEPIGIEKGTIIRLNPLNAWCLPDNAWLDLLDVPESFYFPISNEIVWLDGRGEEPFRLEADEVILSEQVYRLLELDKESEPLFQLRTNTNINTQLRVVGYTKATGTADYSQLETWQNTPGMILSVKFLDWLDRKGYPLYGEDGMIYSRNYYIFTDAPERVTALLKTLDYLGSYSVYAAQDAALAQIQSQAGNKAIIACALLVLLGINLYSSFSNAMNERKYEIGVKRAVGASAWSIVRQFLYESLIVMLANVAISIALVVDVGVLYKIFMEWQSDFLDTYVLYLTPHSMVIFGACAVTLTIVFSLIFAYKSTQVEIVQYLKAE